MPKHAFITGCSRGIGLATALALRERGWRVTATLREGSPDDTLRSAGIEVLRADVTKPEQIEAAVHVAARDGLDAVIANAGAGLFGCFEDLELSEIRSLFELNFFGVLATVQPALPALRASKGRVVLNSSVAGRMAAPGSTAYAATKFAIEGWAEGLRHELRPFGVGVVLVEPGPTESGFSDARVHGARVGKGPYAAMSHRLLELQAELSSRKEPVSTAVNGMLRALEEPDPPLRIPTGRTTTTQLLALSVLPWRVYEHIARRKLALPGSEP